MGKDENGVCEPRPSPECLDPSQFVHASRDLLVSLPLFADIPFHLLEPLLLKCEYRRLRHRELLLSPGQDNSFLYVLLNGELTIHIDSLESEKGFRVQPGEFVGEVSIIDNLAPTAYVTAARDSLLLCINEMVLWSNFFQLPGAARNLLRQIAGRMRVRNAAMLKSVEQTIRLEHLEKELLIARDIQASMLPQRPLLAHYPQVDVDALMEPAREVGGDLFDAFSLDAERICIAIGDVAGKGVPAALFMVRSISLLRTEMMRTRDPLQTISNMNRTLSQDNPQCMFVTLMIGVLNVANGQLQYVNGGHNRPIFGGPGRGFDYLEQPSGILVGITPQAVYRMATRHLNPGDILILYTDGVTEANNPEQAEFTEARLLAVVNQQDDPAAADMVAKIRDVVHDFAAGAEQSDDLTLLVLRYRGS